MEKTKLSRIATSVGFHLLKYGLWDMSWMEAQEAFKRTDTAIVPVGTLHAHGPTPIGIDARSVERLADEVGRRTGLITLPLLPYGENEEMKHYPGSIAINPHTLEDLYVDICRSLHRNGIRKVIFLDGHGGNRWVLTNAGRRIRELGMMIAIVEWYVIGRMIMKDLFPGPAPSAMAELAVAIAIWGKGVPDLRGGYKGEWGPTETTSLNVRKILGEKIVPLGYLSGMSSSSFDYKGAEVIIPVDLWDIDLESPPEVGKDELERLQKRGEEIIRRLADHVAEFAKDFEKVNVPEAFKEPAEHTEPK